jgi:hypothetical protein
MNKDENEIMHERVEEHRKRLMKSCEGNPSKCIYLGLLSTVMCLHDCMGNVPREMIVAMLGLSLNELSSLMDKLDKEMKTGEGRN